MFALANCSSLGTQVKSRLMRAIFAEPLITQFAQGLKGDLLARRPVAACVCTARGKGGPAGGNIVSPREEKRPRLRLRGRFPFEATPSRGGELEIRDSAAQPRFPYSPADPAVVPAHPIWRPIVCGVGLTIGASSAKVK